MFIYPDNLKAKPMLWLWLLRDIAVIGVAALLSVLALSQGLGMGLLVVTVLYAFLTINANQRGSSWALPTSRRTASGRRPASVFFILSDRITFPFSPRRSSEAASAPSPSF